MEHDVKKGWCICGEYHKKGSVEKQPRKKAEGKPLTKKVKRSVKKPPEPKATLSPKEEGEDIRDDDDLKYRFGAPRIF